MKRKTQNRCDIWKLVRKKEGEMFLLTAIHFKSNTEGKDCFLFSHRLHQ